MGDVLHSVSQRLSEIRSFTGLSQTDLARRIDVSTSLISHWEKGTRTPSPEQVQSLAQHLGVSLDYLLNATVRPKFSFRAQKTSPQQEAIDKTLLDASMQAHFISTAFQIAEQTPKPFSLRADFDSYSELPVIAETFRQNLRLNKRVTLEELKQALSEWNIFVFEWQMPWHLSGLSFRGAFSVIIINYLHSPARRLFTLTHEFAHLVFHLDRPGASLDERQTTCVSIASNRDPLEKQANAFAGEFLIPAAEVKALASTLADRLREPGGLEIAARRFNVSRDAIFYRLTELGVFTWADRSKFFQAGFELPKPPDARVHEIDRQVDGRFRELAVGLQQAGKVSNGKLAEWLFTPRDEVEEYLAELTTPALDEQYEEPEQ